MARREVSSDEESKVPNPEGVSRHLGTDPVGDSNQAGPSREAGGPNKEDRDQKD